MRKYDYLMAPAFDSVSGVDLDSNIDFKRLEWEGMMEWTQFIIMFIGMAGLFMWNRLEARTDARHMDTQLRANRDLIIAVHNEIHQEMKDFHGRLCAIEEKNRGK